MNNDLGDRPAASARWARAAAAFSGATIFFFAIALVTIAQRTSTSEGPPGPYAGVLSVLIVVAAAMAAAATVWRYERLARGRFPGRPRWRVFGAWWSLLVMTFLIIGFPLSPWSVAAWVAALGWSLAVSRAAWLYRRAHP